MVLPVNLQSGVDAALSASQTGLNFSRVSSIALDNESKKLDIQQKMAEFQEWQSEDARRYRATMQKIQADSVQFMSENQELINSGWLAEQGERISGSLATWADNESDILATVLSPLMETKDFDEAQRLYRDVIHPQLERFLPDRFESFSVPDVFDEEAWKKAQITHMAAIRNRAQRQQRDLQEQAHLANKEIQNNEQEHRTKLALWDTYSKMLLMDKEWEYKFDLANSKGEPPTLDALGFSEDKLTHAINSMMPRAAEEVRSFFPGIGDDELATVSKALVSDAIQEAKSAWDTIALSGRNPVVVLGGSFQEVFSRVINERLTPKPNGEMPYFTVQEGTLGFGSKIRYNPSGFAGRAAQERERARAATTVRQEGIRDVLSQAKGNPAFDAMSPQAQLRWATKVWGDLESGAIQEIPFQGQSAPAPAPVAEPPAPAPVRGEASTSEEELPPARELASMTAQEKRALAQTMVEEEERKKRLERARASAGKTVGTRYREVVRGSIESSKEERDRRLKELLAEIEEKVKSPRW